MLVRPRRIEHHQHHVYRPRRRDHLPPGLGFRVSGFGFRVSGFGFRRRDHLPPASNTERSTPDDPRQIEQLDHAVTVLNHARDACEGCKLIGSGGGGSVGQPSEERALAHRGKAHKRDARIALAAAFKALLGAMPSAYQTGVEGEEFLCLIHSSGEERNVTAGEPAIPHPSRPRRQCRAAFAIWRVLP